MPEERFWAAVDRSDPDGCWVWTGRRHHGYGVTTVTGRDEGAHRVSYTLAVGPIPDGLGVLHHCDNPPCVRPSHLFVGTQADNNRDMEQKGRAPKVFGEAHWKARLTEEQVRAIRRMRGVGPTAIARQLGATRSAVRHVLAGNSWRWLA